MILLEILEKILASRTENREQLMLEFEKYFLLNDKSLNIPTQVNEIFHDLISDFAYYEPDYNLQIEHNSFFGDNGLEEKIKTALHRIYSLMGDRESMI